MRKWSDVEKEFFTAEEIRESRLRVDIIGELIKARNELGLSQKELEQLSGIKQPVISRMESGETSPQLDTILRVLSALGKTLAIVPLEIAETVSARKTPYFVTNNSKKSKAE